jgi:molecular chaperone Hsp33
MTNERDWARRFHLPDAGVRGVIVRLSDSWREIAARADYPAPVREALGQYVLAAALFAADLRFAGTVSVQWRGEAALSLLFAECSGQGRLRGLAQWQGTGPLEARLTPRALGQAGALAITIERSRDEPRYQGLVPLEGDSFERAFEGYFLRSEQLPTALRMVVDDGQLSGMLVQQVPSEGGHAIRGETLEFERVAALFRTLTAPELADLPVETLLRRLFAEDDVQLQPAAPLAFGCSCSRERVEAMLRSLGEVEVYAARTDSGQVEVKCEFCNQRYDFDVADIAALFAPAGAEVGPRSLH